MDSMAFYGLWSRIYNNPFSFTLQSFCCKYFQFHLKSYPYIVILFTWIEVSLNVLDLKTSVLKGNSNKVAIHKFWQSYSKQLWLDLLSNYFLLSYFPTFFIQNMKNLYYLRISKTNFTSYREECWLSKMLNKKGLTRMSDRVAFCKSSLRSYKID